MKIALAFAALTIATPALAQTMCLPRDNLEKILVERFSEERRSGGISGGQLIEMWASPSGSWTITATSPEGVTCVLAAGHDYNEARAPKGDPT